ncbi:MAG: SCP2 sterol-binding domain-containing protein [Anaerolineales bacterium]|jgi:putative sterol carrier protein
MAGLSSKQILEGMAANFLPDKAAGVNAVVQFHLTGEGGGDWVMNLGNGKCTVAPGTAPTPRLTLTSTLEDFNSIVTGGLDGMAAFAQGKLKLAGDLGLSMKLMGFFKKP